MKLKFFLLLLVFSLQYGLAPSYAMELEDIFKEGQQIRRIQAKSPIYLQWAKGFPEETSSGFQIHSFNTKSKIGFVSTKLDKKRESVDFCSFFIDDTTLSSEVFRTLIGVFKASKNKLPAEIKYLSHTCSRDHQDTINSAKEAGFVESLIYLINPSLLYLVKEIPTQEPVPPQNSNAKQAPLPSAHKSVVPKSLFDSIPPSLPICKTLTVFEVGKKYGSNSNPDIYLQYLDGINMEKVMNIPIKALGFKIFRILEKDEIGYIVPSYHPIFGEIRIGAIWIKENRRCSGYASQAMKTFMAQCTAKKLHFPGAKCFTFGTARRNKAMCKVAQKVGFIETLPTNKTLLEFVDTEIFFAKPFDSGK